VEFTAREANEILVALGLDGVGNLAPHVYNSICDNALRMDTFHSRAQQYLHRHFAAEIIASMSVAEREALAKRAGGATYFKVKNIPSQWQVFIFSAEMKPAVRVLCPVCGHSDGFLPVPDKGITNKTYPSVEEQMAFARAYQFTHCGKKESAPQNTLAEYEKRIRPFCAGFQSTAGDYEQERIRREIASVSNYGGGAPIVPTLQ